MLTLQIISGFTQREGVWNGCSELKEKLLAELVDYNPLSVRIRLDPWRADWKFIAREMHLLRLRYQREPFVVAAFAYSWGVGNGLKKFAKGLKPYGIPITHAVIADGIYHSWLPGDLQWIGNLRAIVGRSQVRLINIRRLEAFHQAQSLPMGQRPILNGTPIDDADWIELTYPHVEVDDAPEWHQRCIDVANELVTRVVRRPEAVPEESPDSEAVLIRKGTT
jgi:hypothetical protein